MARPVVLTLLLLLAGTILPSGSMVVNSCRSAAEQLCNFICDCSNCSDENQCGYLRGSAVLGTPFTCDFEEGDCGWQDVSTSAYRWVRGRASLATWGTGPHSDHTVGTDLGWFMVTVSPPAKTMATAWLRSPVMREAAATCEIRAWYHLSGSGEGAHGGHGWASGYQTRGSDDGGAVGRAGVICPHGRDRATGTSTWVLAILLASSMLCKQSWRDPGVPALVPRAGGVQFVPMPSAKGHVLGLPAGLNQTERPLLRLAMAYKDEVVGLWQSPERGGEGWHQLVAYPGRIAERFQLIFSLTQPPTCGAELALDDIVFRNCGLQEPGQQVCGAEESRCSRGFCLAQHRFCDGTDDCGDGSDEDATWCKSFTLCSFEQNLCSWEVAAGQPAWERNTSLNLGTAYGIPTRDHSNNSRAGFFLHVGSTSAMGASSPARLSSPTFQATNSCSLVLYCHLHGSATSSLSISYVTNSTKHLVRERTGDLGSCWVRERVDFNTTESFKVLIEGVTGSMGTVAIDDLILSPGCVQEQEKPLTTLLNQVGAGPCAAEEVACDSGGCIATELACDFAETCADGSDEKRCGATTFEAGAGGWHDVSVGQLRWGVQRATEPADTVLIGAFLALQAGEGQMVAAARARTPLLGPSGPACAMEMSYRIHSSPQGFLTISVVDHTTGITHLAWHMQGHGGTAGGRVHVPLGERTRPFQVELLGLVDLQDSASAAIDNVTFVQCHLDMVPPGATGMASGAWAGRTAMGRRAPWPPCPQRWVMLPWGLPGDCHPVPSPGTGPWCRSPRVRAEHASSPRTSAWGEPGEWGRGAEEKGHLGDPFAFGVPYPHSLTTVTSLRPALSCNFERGMCGWYQDQSSDFKWVRGTGQGQGSDHTTGLGYFMAVDPTAPWSRGQRAQLVTYRQEPIAAPHCLSFWYRLAGPQIGTLNLKLQLEGVEETVLWTRRGTQGSVWHRGWATLPATGRRQYRVAFEALRDGFLGDMALDDLALTAGPCGAELSCSFEAGACGLAASGQRTWLRQSNGTGTTAGPPADHTTGTATGHYMVVSTGRDSLPAGHAAALTSQPYRPSAPAQCLAFWYQLSGRTPGFLGVFVEQSGVRRKVMGISTMEGDAWHRGHVTVRPDGDWQAIFEAVGAGGNHGYIALDDLHVSDGACPEPASCDFERDMCGWSSPLDPHLHSFAWGWKSGVPLAKYPSPEQDHTLGTRNGHYVHFDTSVLGPGGTTARLESQHLPAAADSCLQFWYHMDIPEHLSCGELRVMLHSVAGQRTVWTMVGHRSQGWRGGVVPVRSPSEFQIIFEVTTRRWPIEGTVALDDIVYSTGRGCHSSQEVPMEEKSSGSFVAEVVLGLLLAVITLALVAAGGWYWLKRRGLVSATPAESNTPQGFDNITFRDDKVIISPVPKEGDEN
ncbi:apical endosomal glycoprotein isoform X2 [Harpia harpyja]|uniref:apical endosomal glycoprotein isoform X2 n=1 Tax=Harpia harpyja TaxID=202280 RepID=UPI0022B1440D|nr:apical endosomal glycoprotein isoform X2 [Harpia harpyja]